MRKIDKTKILSTKYKEWLDQLNHDEEKHSEGNRYYYVDILMNLLHCQKGVCAYTEMMLCHPCLLKADNWKNGRYANKSPQAIGELDHFNYRLKKNKCWEWQNLFVVLERINRMKRDKAVDDILKPDSPQYDPAVLLEYHEKSNMFIPHTGIEDEVIRERIQHMIDVLQINYPYIRGERKRFLKEVFKARELGWPIEIDRFFTAYQMAAAAKEEEE